MKGNKCTSILIERKIPFTSQRDNTGKTAFHHVLYSTATLAKKRNYFIFLCNCNVPLDEDIKDEVTTYIDVLKSPKSPKSSTSPSSPVFRDDTPDLDTPDLDNFPDRGRPLGSLSRFNASTSIPEIEPEEGESIRDIDRLLRNTINHTTEFQADFLNRQHRTDQDIYDLYENFPVKYALDLKRREKKIREENQHLLNTINRLQQLIIENSPETFKIYHQVIASINIRNLAHHNIQTAKFYIKQIESELEKKKSLKKEAYRLI